ncbi:mannosylglycerate hydrolase [Catenulispora sp. MAP12-49]|uniref:glycoside hydrolase family 38 N-terminal domain-containing protein n=1 Tax=Catenulispora sp. MAP12-49 TaxID=3156302 RepID=UPI003517AFAA
MNELVIVPHTHWDREWYQPFQRFRLRLVTVLDRLLAQLAADPRARFTLDGQTAAIDDYLEIRPEQEALVRELAGRGQLALGPWRVLADSFLCSGENLIRNLETGSRRADELGGAMRVGYLPDQFGHAAQLPQILRLAGIEHACVWRGVPEDVRTTEFWWAAPDGTAVRTRYLPEGGYGGAAGVFGEPDAAVVRRRAEEHVQALRRWQPDGPLLGMYGTDHSAPVDGLADLVEGASGEPLRVRLDTLAGFFDIPIAGGRAPAQHQPAAHEPNTSPVLITIHGELRSHARANILPGVLSSRIGLKQALSRAERLVERYAEPIAALYGTRSACRPFLDLAWRRLVDSSCHDSVTGCGIDATADQVAARIAEADDLGRGVVDLVLGPIAQTVPDGGHLLFNPSARHRREVVTLDLPAGRAPRAASGKALPHQILDTVEENIADELVPTAALDLFLRKIHGRELYGRQIAAWHLDPDAATITFELAPTSPLVFDVAEVRAAAAAAAVEIWRVEVRVQPRATVAALIDVGPLALAAVTTFTTGSPPPAALRNIAAGRRALSDLDNGLMHVALRSDGLLDVLAADGSHAAGLGAIVDGGDLGDEYNYAPPGHDRLVSSPDEIWNRVRWSGPFTGSLESVRWFNWPTHGVPVSASDTEVSGIRAATVHTTEVSTRIELRHGEPFVRLTIAFDNQCDDHRVRLHLPLPRPATHSHAEGQFAVASRPLHAEGGFGERPLPTFPAYGWVAAGGLAVLLDHVSEYELVDDGRTLALTLLRSVGLLSRNDNAWRAEPAGPQLPTPGAQCRGPRTVELALYLYAGEWHESGLLDAAERYRHPLTTVAGRNEDPGSVPVVPAGGIEVGGRGVVLSSCRDTGAEDPELRLVALTPKPTTATIRTASTTHTSTHASTHTSTHTMEMRPWQVASTIARGASKDQGEHSPD